MLGALDWEKLTYADKENLSPDDQAKLEETVTTIDMKASKQSELFDAQHKSTDANIQVELDFPFMVRQLMEVVPNPWQATRIIQETLSALEATSKLTPEKLYASRIFIIQEIKRDIQRQVHEASEAMFREKLASGDIQFKLMASANETLNWELAETLTLSVKDTDRIFKQRNGEDLECNLFEKVYQRELNDLEQDVAWYLDGHDAVKWWHRLIVKQDYHLQGWQKNRVYPDFLACMERKDDGAVQFTILETKGQHLKGNDDTAYKASLFDVLTEHYNQALEAGSVELPDADGKQMVFKMLLEESWKSEISTI